MVIYSRIFGIMVDVISDHSNNDISDSIHRSHSVSLVAAQEKLE